MYRNLDALLILSGINSLSWWGVFNSNSSSQSNIPVIYYIATIVGGIVLAFITGRIVVDPASYAIPDYPSTTASIIVLIVYELLVLPWLYKTRITYAVIRILIIPTLASSLLLPYSVELHTIILLLGSTIILMEAKILLDLAAIKRKVLYSIAGIFRGLTGFMALVYTISLITPSLRSSIITITQLILALLPFIILGAYMGLTLYMLTMTRDPLKLASMLIPLTLIAIILTIITYIYTQPALTNPNIALETYGNMTRIISLLAPIIVIAQTLLEKRH